MKRIIIKIVMFSTIFLTVANTTSNNVINLNEDQYIKIKKQEEAELQIQREHEEQLLREKRAALLRIENEHKRINSTKYNSENLLVMSQINKEEMELLLDNTGLKPDAQSFVIAEQTQGVNALVLVAIAAEESGWGNSNRAQNQNNLTGYAVYSNSSKGGSFSTREENILSTAKLLKDCYLDKSGPYYNGESLEAVSKKYSANRKWKSNVDNIANNLAYKYRKIKALD